MLRFYSYAHRAFSVLIVIAASVVINGAPPAAHAVAPGDFGLREGDVVSAHNTAGDPDIYIVNEFGFKRLFVNPEIFNLYGHLGWNKVRSVSAATRDAFVTSGLFRNCEVGASEVYGLEVVSEDVANLRHINITGAQAVAQDPDFFRKVFCINNNEVRLYGTGPAWTSLSQVPDYSRSQAAPVPTPSPAPALQGTEGMFRNVRLVAEYANESVGERYKDWRVLGLDIEAGNESDIRLLSVQLTFSHTGSGSSKIKDYAKAVSVFFGEVKVGELNASGFTESSGDWTTTMTLPSNVIIRASETRRLAVGVSALDQIDSANLDENWTVTVNRIRFEDGAGAVMTDSTTGDLPATRTFAFGTFADAANISLSLTEAADNPAEKSVLVDDDATTPGVLLLSTTLRAAGGDITIRGMTVTVTPSGTGDTSEIADFVSLEIGGTVVGVIQSDQCETAGDCDGTGTNTAVEYVFDDFTHILKKNQSVNVRVLVEINKLDGTLFAEGDNLKAGIDNDDTDARDERGDDLDASQLKGTVNGDYQEFGTKGAVFFFIGASTSVVTSNNAPDIGTFTIQFGGVTTNADSFVQENCTKNGGDGVDFNVSGSGTYVSCSVTSSAENDGPHGNFELVDGAPPATFTLTVIVQGSGDFVRVYLQGIDWLYSDIANPPVKYNVGMDKYETGTIFLSAT